MWVRERNKGKNKEKCANGAIIPDSLFQPCDVGIQRVLKLAIRCSTLHDIINDTAEQLSCGALPSTVTFEEQLSVVRDRSVRWLVNGYEAINNPTLIKKVIFKCVHNFSHSSHVITGF